MLVASSYSAVSNIELMILHASALSARSAHYRLDAFRRVFSNRTYAA
uniref:Uncharacterized protein n=1 Tax=Peronospora matthiolae TaxID=2874970 RepID=A0AAV1VF03_9STRA